MTNQNTKMTAAERAAAEAKIKGLRAEANALAKKLKEEEVTAKAHEATQLSIKEAEATEEVVETPVEEVEVTEEVVETTVEEAEVTEEVTETPEEEAEVAEEVTETPEEEAEVTEEVTETPEEEAEVAEEVTETSEEEAEVTEEVTETPEEEAEVTETTGEENKKDKKSIWMGILCGALTVCLIVICFLAASVANKGNEPSALNDDPTNSDTPNEDTLPTQPVDPVTPADPAFDMNAFVNSVVNIAGEFTEEDVAANVDILCENIGADKLKELIDKYGELSVKKGIAELLVHAPEVKMDHYINKNGLNFNPNAVLDYSEELQKLDDAYRAATGKNPDGALMSLPGYDAFNGNRDALRALIVESGDTALLTWYNAKMEIYDTMRTQNSDTDEALAYKESVEAEILASVGTVKLLELQLEKEASGELTVMDNVSMQYTESYYSFILNNYVYVVAN